MSGRWTKCPLAVLFGVLLQCAPVAAADMQIQTNRVWISTAASLTNGTTLFNSNGVAVAYVVTDDDMTVYLWSGKPVAYLYDGYLWGFNGRYLGWFENGVVWDCDGYVAGCLKDVVAMDYGPEPLKSTRELKPSRALRELRPLKPLKTKAWSARSLTALLLKGPPE